MAAEQGAGTGAIKPEGSAPGRSPIVFVSDASAEAERIGDTLRAAGYVVADVPIALLTSRRHMLASSGLASGKPYCKL